MFYHPLFFVSLFIRVILYSSWCYIHNTLTLIKVNLTPSLLKCFDYCKLHWPTSFSSVNVRSLNSCQYLSTSEISFYIIYLQLLYHALIRPFYSNSLILPKKSGSITQPFQKKIMINISDLLKSEFALHLLLKSLY